jgi:glyoxylase-like metal-dependent hydrolase (beta-lactamase superfamily II)
VELIRLTDSAYQLHAGTNAGLIVRDGQAVLIDTGLDRDAARKILRAAATLSIRIAGIVITHAHADHFGGAAMLRDRTGAPVYAPALEAAVVANPQLEPLYLFSGAAAPSELRHKFTLAEPCPVDRLLEPGPLSIGSVVLQAIPAPGHAPNQMMIAAGGACFVADACFAPEILEKHGIPFYSDVVRAADTLDELARLDGSYAVFVPGHGEAIGAIAPWASVNAERLAEIRRAVYQSLLETPVTAEIIRLTLGRMNVAVASPVLYLLAQTTVLACLSALELHGEVVARVVDNRLHWLPEDRSV